MNPDMTPDQMRKEHGIRFKHFVHKTTGKILATLVSRPVDDNMVEVAVAICASTDPGSRVVGRSFALEKLNIGDNVKILPKETLAAMIKERLILKLWKDSYPGPSRLRAPLPAPVLRGKVISGRVDSVSVKPSGGREIKLPVSVLDLTPSDRGEIE